MAGARRDAATDSESDVNSESRLIYSAAEKPAMRWDSHLTTHTPRSSHDTFVRDM